VVPVLNVYYLLCYAWDYADTVPLVDVGGAAAERMENLLAQMLITGASSLLRRGLDRSYVDERDELCPPRGKIDLSSTIKRSVDRTGRLACVYDELRHDVLHNRLLRATMLRLASSGIERKLARELVRMAERMHGVSDIAPEPHLFRRVQLHRNNAHYRFLLHICELVVRHLIPVQNGAGFRFADFRGDEREMGALFEAFVRNFLRREQAHFAVSGEYVAWVATPMSTGAEALLPLMRTDISLVAPGCKVVIDTKFYQHPLRSGRDGKKKLREEHLYQVYAYLKNLEAGGTGAADTALLLYAATDERFDLRYKLGPHEIRARTLDLNQPWQSIRSDLLELSEELRRAPLLRGEVAS
jgi:5-methylcytosine-specific restriction enzyme subunit McrC